MLYTTSDIDDILNKANVCTYALRNLSDLDITQRGTDIVSKQLDLIYLLKKTVEYQSVRKFNDNDFHLVAGYLLSKLDYSFDYIFPLYPDVGEADTGDDGSTNIPKSGFQKFIQINTGDTPLQDGTIYHNPLLAGRHVMVISDGLMLSAGLTDRVSYNYNIGTGTISFNTDITGSVLQIFTYIPTMAGWTLFKSITVGGADIPSGGDTYTNPLLIGKNVLVEVDGLLLPLDLIGSFYYSFNPFLGQVSWSEPLQTDQVVTIYTY